MTRIVCRQLHPALLDVASNARLTRDAVRESVAAGADVVVLPELVTSGYVYESVDEIRTAAIRADHPIFSEWAAAAGDAVVIGGFAEAGDDGEIYSSAAVVDRTGVLAVHRKTHLWDREKLFFAAGSVAPPVVETRHGRIGVLICYELEFPEMTRALALEGADLLAVPTNWPLVARPEGERPPEVVMAMAAARASRVAIACCDRRGVERGQEWTRGSAVIGVDGWVVAEPANHIVMADVDLLAARDKRLGEHADALGDRRPELYGSLTEPR